MAVAADFGAASVGLVAVAMLLTALVRHTGDLLMSIYHAVVNRFVIPVIEAHKDEGRKEGLAKAQAEWRGWNERRVAAEREGREFAEAPPEL